MIGYPMSNENLPIDDAESLPDRGQRRLLFKISILFVFSVVVGGMLGASTNVVNGYLSPKYFVEVMGWNQFLNIWEASVIQGGLEGAVYGAAFSIIFIALISAMSHGTFEIQTALRYVLLSFAVAILLWCIGGAIAVLYVWVVPNPNPRHFGSRDAFDKRIAYAWVRGSIWGGVFGGPYAVTISLVIYALRYCRPLKREQTSHPEVM